MQTPLITNFSRGILDPKFHGRVDSELYSAGAADIKNFIVNNQGSLQRRPGTYRLWATGNTVPSPAGSDTDRFEVDVVPGQKYSLVLLADDGGSAQFILSVGGESGAGAHRFFEVEKGEYDNQFDINTFKLTEFEQSGEYYPEAHSFATEGNQIVDDSFISTFGDLAFLRTRNPLGYEGLQARVWHSVLSRDIARDAAETIPFVNVGPQPPPRYKKEESTLDHEVGFRIFNADGDEQTDHSFVLNTRSVPHFVGQIMTGQYEDSVEASFLKDSSGFNNVSQNFAISDPGWITISIPNAIGSYVFYDYFSGYNGRSKIIFNGRALSSEHVKGINRTAETVQISFDGLRSAASNWTSISTIQIRRTKKKRYCPSGVKYPNGSCVGGKSTRYKNRVDSINLPSDRFAQFQNTEYIPETDISYQEGEGIEYELYYYEGGKGQKIHAGKFSVQNDGTNITKVVIANEMDIHPDGKKGFPNAGARYRLERTAAVMDQDVITRRVKPWVKTETPNDNSLEFVMRPAEWLEQSVEILKEGKTVFVHNGRLMVLEEESELKFLVSAIKDYANFYQSDSEVDAYRFDIETDRKERIQWVISVRDGMIIGTDRNEYVVLGAEAPSSVVAQRYTGFGSSRPYAVRFGDKILFVSRDAKRIMSYSYSDEMAAWYSEDITSVAQSLFKRGIKSMHYMEDPISGIWVVPEDEDGMYLLTWEPATGVMAWSRHLQGTKVLAASVATIGGHTALFMAVDRQGKVFIEVLDVQEGAINERDYYVDSAEFLVFSWLEGETGPRGPDNELMTENYTIDFGTDRWARFQNHDVVFMVNGVAEKVMIDDDVPLFSTSLTIGPLEGADIPITVIEDAFIVVAIGMPFTSRLTTLPILVQSPSGAGVFKNTQVNNLRIRIQESGTFMAGNSLEDMTRVELAEEEQLIQNEDTSYYTGDVEFGIQSRWMKRPMLYIESYYADPLNLLAIMVDSQVYE